MYRQRQEPKPRKKSKPANQPKTSGSRPVVAFFFFPVVFSPVSLPSTRPWAVVPAVCPLPRHMWLTSVSPASACLFLVYSKKYSPPPLHNHTFCFYSQCTRACPCPTLATAQLTQRQVVLSCCCCCRSPLIYCVIRQSTPFLALGSMFFAAATIVWVRYTYQGEEGRIQREDNKGASPPAHPSSAGPVSPSPPYTPHISHP